MTDRRTVLLGLGAAMAPACAAVAQPAGVRPPPPGIPPPPPIPYAVPPGATARLLARFADIAPIALAVSPASETLVLAYSRPGGSGDAATLSAEPPGLTPILGLQGRDLDVKGVHCDIAGNTWVLTATPAPALLKVQAAGRTTTYPLDGLSQSPQWLSDVVVSPWRTHQAYIAEAGVDGALIVLDLEGARRGWRVEHDVSRTAYYSDRPPEPHGPRSLTLVGDDLIWSVRGSPGVFRLTTAALGVPEAAGKARTWLSRRYEIAPTAVCGGQNQYYAIDGQAGAVWVAEPAGKPIRLLQNGSLRGAVDLTLGARALYALVATATGGAEIWRIVG